MCSMVLRQQNCATYLPTAPIKPVAKMDGALTVPSKNPLTVVLAPIDEKSQVQQPQDSPTTKSASDFGSTSMSDTEEPWDPHRCASSFTIQLGSTKDETKIYSLDMLQRICTIGTGTFGRVILSQHKQDKEFYALKMMSMKCLVESKQVEHVHSEKRILSQIQHPFIVSLYWTYRDSKCLYMLFDYIPGGELFSYLRNAGHFDTYVGRFYASEIVLALEYLHEHNIAYRDLKPENLLLDAAGHLKLTDFGFAKELYDRAWTLCGTPEYLAPEVVENKGHNSAVDWWALGVLIYEMLAGYPPFTGENTLMIYEKILEGRPKYPKYFDLVAKDLCRKLMTAERTKRLGNMKNGAADVKDHKFFHQVEWHDCYARKLKAPIIPHITHEGDPGNYDEYDEESWDEIREASEYVAKEFINW